MTRQGWVAIYRKLKDHWLWSDKPFAKGQAWIDLLLLASHNDNEFLFGNQVVKVEQGSFITSELKLADRWGWGRKKVRCFLELLQNEQMLIKKGDNKKTTITIVNYSIYADFRTAKEQQRNTRGTPTEQQRNTINNDNNNNNVNNDNKKEKKERKNATYDDILSQISDDSLRETYLEYIKMRKMIKSPMTDRALTMLIKKVNELEPTDIDRQKQLLETAIMNNWKSVYPLKEDKPKKNNIAAYNESAFERMLNAIDDPPATAAEDESIRAKAEELKNKLQGA